MIRTLLLAIVLIAPSVTYAGGNEHQRSEYCARVALRDSPSLYAQARCRFIGRPSRLRTYRYLRHAYDKCSKAECMAHRYWLRHGRSAPWTHR